MKLVIAIAAGGAVGAVARHFFAAKVMSLAGAGFPWGILCVNVLGSFAMGCLVEAMAIAWSPGPAVRAFLVVGFLGAFTTFSAFSMDVALLYERGQLLAAGLYVSASVALSVGALFLGLYLVRLALA